MTTTHSTSSHHSSTQSSSSTTITSSTSSSSTSGFRSESDYVTRMAPRFERLAGSNANLQSLVHGMRTGAQITLAGATGTDAVVFSPPMRRMSYGDITQALELAKQELATIGLPQPSPHELSAALNGGTIVTANGETTLSGILQNRSRGMSWGRIAHLAGVRSASERAPERATGHATASGSGVRGGNASVSRSGVSAGNAGVTFGPGGMRVQAGDATR
ncbi:MAG TPA: hypothetical protein VED01_20635 [Burkholderiales bacterium]|nr:hypothetical protein [Burkholderiales bacterium]